MRLLNPLVGRLAGSFRVMRLTTVIKGLWLRFIRRVVLLRMFFRVLGATSGSAWIDVLLGGRHLVYILKGYLWDCNLALALVASGLSADLLGNGFESILSEVVALKATPATTGIVRGCDHL